jgi:hypothetical protein
LRRLTLEFCHGEKRSYMKKEIRSKPLWQ